MAFASPHVAECPHESIPFVADRIVKAHDHRISQREPKPDATGIFRPGQIELRGRGSHFPRFGKDGRVPAREEVPAVFGCEQQRALVIEPVTFKPSQEVVAAERGLQVKRNGLTLPGLRGNHGQTQSHNAGLVPVWEVLFHRRIPTVERVPAEVLIPVAPEVKVIIAPCARTGGQVTVVVLHCKPRPQKVRLLVNTGCLVRSKLLFGRGEALSFSGSGVRRVETAGEAQPKSLPHPVAASASRCWYLPAGSWCGLPCGSLVLDRSSPFAASFRTSHTHAARRGAAW